MRILQLCKKFPYPVKDGESITITYLAKAPSQLGCEVTLLAMNTSKHRVDTGALDHGEFDHYAAAHRARRQPHPAGRGAAQPVFRLLLSHRTV